MQIAQNIIHCEETSSTNDYLVSLISNVEPIKGIGVIADYQTSGKGQIGRKWESEKAKNLLFSFVIYPNILAVQNQFYISKMVSLALHKTVEDCGIKSVKIKWPNDIYIQDLKVSGILIQNSLKGDKINYSIIGIGLNINQDNFTETIPNPTSLSIELGRTLVIQDVLEILVKNLNIYYESLIQNRFDNLTKEYHANLYRINEECSFQIEEEKVKGYIRGVTEEGYLILEKEHKPSFFKLNELKMII